VNVSPRTAAPDQGTSVERKITGFLVYEFRGKLQIQILCGADDIPRSRMDTADSHDCDPRLTRGGKSVRDQGLVLVPIGQLLKPRWSITISNSVNPARALTNWTSPPVALWLL
jgi:hypothetical protein